MIVSLKSPERQGITFPMGRHDYFAKWIAVDLKHDIIMTGRRGAASSFKEVRYAVRLSDRYI